MLIMQSAHLAEAGWALFAYPLFSTLSFRCGYAMPANVHRGRVHRRRPPVRARPRPTSGSPVRRTRWSISAKITTRSGSGTSASGTNATSRASDGIRKAFPSRSSRATEGAFAFQVSRRGPGALKNILRGGLAITVLTGILDRTAMDIPSPSRVLASVGGGRAGLP